MDRDGQYYWPSLSMAHNFFVHCSSVRAGVKNVFMESVCACGIDFSTEKAYEFWVYGLAVDNFYIVNIIEDPQPWISFSPNPVNFPCCQQCWLPALLHYGHHTRSMCTTYLTRLSHTPLYCQFTVIGWTI